ncbi:hypothetical protein [Alloactinosynnema sp. L-07]|uniref:hypothetical protein n=1 Tax=Alloactinosynnema sp. L-07 TaxID=1653480 RepID=UPI00065EF48C|nr:hypothetical protein [Alloactinosynnema sp. L-07]CRK59045.1 hypothetical protein [Alloactinosynnema sp. L-07]
MRVLRDERTFIAVHDGIEDHPKIAELSDAAFRLLVTTWGYCSRYTTDGFVKDAVWRKRGTPKARRELEAELVHKPGHDCPKCPPVPPGYVRFHDYLEHQRSAKDIEERQEQKREAGRRGNHQRWHVDQNIVEPSCRYCTGQQDDGSQVRSQPPSQTGSQTDRETIAEEEVEEEEKKKITTPVGGKPHQPRASAKTTAAELDATAHSPTAFKLVRNYADTCARRPPTKVLTALAVQVDLLLAEDWPHPDIGRALAELGARGKHAKLLPDIAHELANRSPTNGNGARPSSSDSAAAAVQALKTTRKPAATAPAQIAAGGAP